MRLLEVKEVQNSKLAEEERMRERMRILGEELHRKERVLAMTMESIDGDKQKLNRDFENFRAIHLTKKRELEGQIRNLEKQKNVLEIDTIRERASTLALDELENTFLAKKQEVEDSLKERSGKLTKKEKEFLYGIQEYTFQLELVNERAISQDEREKNIHDQKNEIRESQEKLAEQSEDNERNFQSRKEELEQKLIEIDVKQASNNLVKGQLAEKWEELEKERMEFTQEKNSVADRLLEAQEQEKAIEREKEYQEKTRLSLEDEWKKMEIERVGIKEQGNKVDKVEEKLQQDIKIFKTKVVANKLEKDQIEREWKEYYKQKKHLADERMTLNSAWKELQNK